MRNTPNLKITRARLFAIGTALVTTLALPTAAAAMPAPYVSRALDAVLIPVDDEVRGAFGLAATDKGVLVLATSPGGVGEAAGIKPGDVISKAYGKPISNPINLDEIVYYWISQGSTDFGFDVWSGGVETYYTSVITLESYSEGIDVTTVSTWSSYSSESFSYEEYTSEYSEEISESYESSESLIEETTSSEEFAAEQSEESSEDDASADGTDEGGDDAADEGGDAAGDEGGDDAGDEGGDDAGGDEGGDDASAEDAGGDDAGADDAGGDDGGDAGGDDSE
jgi:hypothetical protein